VGSAGSGRPLSAQAQAPSRPSGDAKEQQPAQEGGAGTGLRPPGDRAEIAADRHRLKTLVWSPKVAEQREFRVKPDVGPAMF
jgi:hypothetical protein